MKCAIYNCSVQFPKGALEELVSETNFDIIMYTNADGLGTDCVSHAHRLPFIKGIAKAMEGIGKILVVLRYRSIPQCWFVNDANYGKISSDESGLNQLADNLWTIRPTVIGNTLLASHFSPLNWDLLRVGLLNPMKI